MQNQWLQDTETPSGAYESLFYDDNLIAKSNQIKSVLVAPNLHFYVRKVVGVLLLFCVFFFVSFRSFTGALHQEFSVRFRAAATVTATPTSME